MLETISRNACATRLRMRVYLHQRASVIKRVAHAKHTHSIESFPDKQCSSFARHSEWKDPTYPVSTPHEDTIQGWLGVLRLGGLLLAPGLSHVHCTMMLALKEQTPKSVPRDFYAFLCSRPRLTLERVAVALGLKPFNANRRGIWEIPVVFDLRGGKVSRRKNWLCLFSLDATRRNGNYRCFQIHDRRIPGVKIIEIRSTPPKDQCAALYRASSFISPPDASFPPATRFDWERKKGKFKVGTLSRCSV